MRQALSVLSLALVLGVTVGNVVEVVELDIYSSLAPCAKYAVSYHIQKQTYSKCPDDATALQECICTKNNNFASISSEVSSSIAYSCGSTATEDQASASTVLSAYCNQESLPTFPTPTIGVNAYITEVAEVAALAPCAQNALGYAVGSLTYTHCPSDAPALASCACSKLGMSSLAAKGISSSAKYSCSSHTADVSSALAFFDAFCAMGEGISEFPRPTNPPGDMTYYITDLPAYTSLAKCAAAAISYAVQWQTEDLCPEGPQALASCACLKDSMTKEILSSISSNVRYSCDSTATDDISSAVSVYNYYCSAAQSLVVAEGVTASVGQPTLGGPPLSGSRSGSGAQATGTGTSGASNGGKSGEDGTSNGPSTTVIAGAVVGVIVLLGLIGLAVFFVMRHARRKKGEQLPDNVPMTTSPGNADYYGNGKQELPADSIAAGAIPPPSPAPSTLKPGTLPPRSETVSPVSAHGGTFSPPKYHAELSGQAPPVPPLPHSAELPVKASPHPPMPHGAELQGYAPAYPPPANTAELYGQGATHQHPPRPELQGQGAMYPPQHRPELQGNGAMYSPPNHQELQGQGAPYPGPFRQELAGQFNYPPPPQQPPQAYTGYNPHTPVSPASTYVQNSPSPHAPGMGWQSGPVPAVHEMDGGYAPSPPAQGR